MKTTSMLLVLLFSVNAIAMGIPQAVVDECTATQNIYFETKIKGSSGAGLDKDFLRSIALRALGVSETSSNYSAQRSTGQWLFEYENDHAVFASYSVRSHYLSVAVVYQPNGLSTIICNSKNMKQKEQSIHRKASPWKGMLDSKLRLEISRASSERNKSGRGLKQLDALKSSGFVTEKEYQAIRGRIEAQQL